MIGYIKGKIEEIYSDCILLDCNGMGYRIFVPSTFVGAVSYGETLKVYTYLSVREDSMTLFGFKSRDELDVYKLLLSVNGVGPKAAMGVLSALDAEQFKYAILTSDVKKLSNAPGIGKKTAQKIILELKDKFDFSDAFDNEEKTASGSAGLKTDAASDTVAALEALGYSASDALKAVRRALADGVSEESGMLLKAALKNMF